MADQDIQARIRAHPLFAALVAARARLVLLLSLLVLLPYYAFMLLAAYCPDWLARPLAAGSVITLGWPLAVGLIVGAWLSTGLYIWWANRVFDRRNAQILREVSR